VKLQTITGLLQDNCSEYASLKALSTLQLNIFQTLTLGQQIYYQLCQPQQTVWTLSEDASKTLDQAFISCHLDYCNSDFGISERLMNRLQ